MVKNTSLNVNGIQCLSFHFPFRSTFKAVKCHIVGSIEQNSFGYDSTSVSMNLIRYTRKLLSSPLFLENIAINQQARFVTTYNDRGPRKNRPPNQEERLAAALAKRKAKSFDEILTAFGDTSILTPDKWREYTKEPSKSSLLWLLDILKMLKPPKDSLQSAKNLLEAFNIESNAAIDARLIDLYVKHHREKRHLSKADEIEVLKM